MNGKTKSQLLGFGLNIIIMTVGTLLFGVLLEKFKSDAQLRTDIVKEYYRPLKEKEAQCSSLNRKLVKSYQEVGDDYNFIRDRYLSFKNGTGPALNDEYKNFLTKLLSDVTAKNAANSKINTDYVECKIQLTQLQVDTSLVTGTYGKISKILKGKNNTEASANSKFREEVLSPIIKDLPPDIANRLVNGFFDAGNLEKPIDPSADQFVTDMIDTLMPKIIKVFPEIADYNVKVSLMDQKYNNQINQVFEEEISSQFSRGFISKFFI